MYYGNPSTLFSNLGKRSRERERQKRERETYRERKRKRKRKKKRESKIVREKKVRETEIEWGHRGKHFCISNS